MSELCGTCGQPHVTRTGQPACTGHISGGVRPERKGEPCTAPRMHGQVKCSAHGGRSPQAKAKAQERLEMDRIARLARTLGDPIEGRDPAEIIAEQIAHRAGLVAWLRLRVQQIEPDDLMWGITKDKVGGDDEGVTREAKPNAWYVAYIDAARDLEKLCLDAIKVGLDERRIRLAEKQADAMIAVLEGVLSELGHDMNDQETAAVVLRHLTAIDGGPV